MKIILNYEGSGEETRLVNYEVKDSSGITLDELISGFFCILDETTRQLLKAHPDALDDLYEHYNGVFDLFLRKVFPEPPEDYFELSDAALIYAQDKIIDEAESKGISFEEALKKYENRAKEHLRQKREGLA